MRRIILCQKLSHIEHLTARDLYLSATPLKHKAQTKALVVPFSNAKNLLGQSFRSVVFNAFEDGNLHFNLTAFAIAQGTLQAGGDLVLVLPELNQCRVLIDHDSSRYFPQAQACPHFFDHLYRLLDDSFCITQVLCDLRRLREAYPPWHKGLATELFEEQEKIYQNITASLNFPSIHALIAPRGRGKSALLAHLCNYVQTSGQKKVIFCARSISVMQTFWQHLNHRHRKNFIAPDKLLQMIAQGAIAADTIVVIDEAAALPLDSLKKCCDYFHTLIMATTLDSYEGSGRGFMLKFLPALGTRVQIHQLTRPLRFLAGDPIERFANQLLLLDRKTYEAESIFASLKLLTEAHYQTSPNDVRRILDDSSQWLVKDIVQDRLRGCALLLDEGAIDKEHISAIIKGTKRIKGHLVAQYLGFHRHSIAAMALRSSRISRIVVAEGCRNQGIGTHLVKRIKEQAVKNGADFLSVCFGKTEQLVNFWRKQGFVAICSSQKPNTATGLFSQIMLFALSEDGEKLIKNLIDNR